MWEIEGLEKPFISSSFQWGKLYSSLFLNGIQKPFSTLGEYLKRVKDNLTLSYIYEEWNYVFDPDVNMKVLSVEKDPEALNKIDKIIEELYK